MIEKIAICWAQLSQAQQSQLEAQKQYIAKASELPLYGSIFYLAKWAVSRKQLRDVLVAVNQVSDQNCDDGNEEEEEELVVRVPPSIDSLLFLAPSLGSRLDFICTSSTDLH